MDENHGHRQLMDDLNHQRGMFSSVRMFEAYLITNHQVDIALIILMKSVIAHSLFDQHSAVMTDHSETIQAYYDYSSNDTYEQWAEKTWQEIGPLEVYAEGPFVDLHLIPRFFNSICYLVEFVDTNISCHDNFNDFKDQHVSFYIVLDEDHYNILYPRARSHRAEVHNNSELILEGGEHNPVNCPLSPLPSEHQEDQTLEYHKAED